MSGDDVERIAAGLTAEEREIAAWLHESSAKVWQRKSWRIWQWYGRWVARNAWMVASEEVVRRANLRIERNPHDRT